MSFPTWPPDVNNITDSVFKNTILDGQVDVSGTFYNRTGNVIIGDSSNPDFDPSSNGITLNTTRICLGKDSSVTGDNGVAIGPDASANGLNSIALGYNSGTGSYTNSIALGANSTVGANDVISLGDGTQKVGIGTTSPSTTLQINGDYFIAANSSGWSNPGTGIYMRYSINGGQDAAYIQSGNRNTSTWKPMHFQSNTFSFEGGYVGIGTTSPSFPLDIVGNVGATVYGAWLGGSGNISGPSNTGHGIGIRTTGGVYTSAGSLISSDRRIKTNITEINDASSLDKIRLLKPSYYNYIDTTDRTSSVVEGFIAQEVKEVLPYAVLLQTSYIPNIFKVGSYNSLDNIITINDYDTNTLEYDASNNVFKKIILYDISDNKYECEINEIIASNQIKIQSSEDIPTDIFVYGQEVDNFNTLKKEAIFTVATAALQEVDRQLQAEKVKTATLETKVATLEAQITDLLARLDALENP